MPYNATLYTAPTLPLFVLTPSAPLARGPWPLRKPPAIKKKRNAHAAAPGAPHGYRYDGAVYEGDSFKVAVAPTGRARCKKGCSGLIAKGCVKLVRVCGRAVTDHPDYSGGYYQDTSVHLGCAHVHDYAKRAVDRYGSAADVPGVRELPPAARTDATRALGLLAEGKMLPEKLQELAVVE